MLQLKSRLVRYFAMSLSQVSQISTDIYETLVTLPNPDKITRTVQASSGWICQWVVLVHRLLLEAEIWAPHRVRGAWQCGIFDL